MTIHWRKGLLEDETFNYGMARTIYLSGLSSSKRPRHNV